VSYVQVPFQSPLNFVSSHPRLQSGLPLDVGQNTERVRHKGDSHHLPSGQTTARMVRRRLTVGSVFGLDAWSSILRASQPIGLNDDRGFRRYG
jgi:hypothetical protein